MSFDVTADAYTRFMGRYSKPLPRSASGGSPSRSGSGRPGTMWRRRCRELLGEGPFEVSATAWAVTSRR